MRTVLSPPVDPDEVTTVTSTTAAPTLKPITKSQLVGDKLGLVPAPGKPPSNVTQFKGAQEDLAFKATVIADMALDKMRRFLEVGTDLGTGVTVPCSPAAVVSIYKEARETIATPIKTAQDDRTPSTPVSINTNNPDVIRAVIAELRRYRDERHLDEAGSVEHQEEECAA